MAKVALLFFFTLHNWQGWKYLFSFKIWQYPIEVSFEPFEVQEKDITKQKPQLLPGKNILISLNFTYFTLLLCYSNFELPVKISRIG